MIVAFTGAGISKASGIPTFEESPELRDTLYLRIWNQRPAIVWSSIWQLYDYATAAKPNPAHILLAQHSIPVITQNIDGLHQAAGSTGVIELHGNLRNATCHACKNTVPLASIEHQELPRCPECRGLLKPNVVLFGEDIFGYREALERVVNADLLLVIGTSLTVQPAANLVAIASRLGIRVVTCNRNAEHELGPILEDILNPA